MDPFQNLRGQLCRQMFLGVVEHGGADAVAPVGAVENINIDASLASAPERLVVGEVVECYRFIFITAEPDVREKIFA